MNFGNLYMKPGIETIYEEELTIHSNTSELQEEYKMKQKSFKY